MTSVHVAEGSVILEKGPYFGLIPRMTVSPKGGITLVLMDGQGKDVRVVGESEGGYQFGSFIKRYPGSGDSTGNARSARRAESQRGGRGRGHGRGGHRGSAVGLRPYLRPPAREPRDEPYEYGYRNSLEPFQGDFRAVFIPRSSVIQVSLGNWAPFEEKGIPPFLIGRIARLLGDEGGPEDGWNHILASRVKEVILMAGMGSMRGNLGLSLRDRDLPLETRLAVAGVSIAMAQLAYFFPLAKIFYCGAGKMPVEPMPQALRETHEVVRAHLGKISRLVHRSFTNPACADLRRLLERSCQLPQGDLSERVDTQLGLALEQEVWPDNCFSDKWGNWTLHGARRFCHFLGQAYGLQA